jgi:hypothetical protein
MDAWAWGTVYVTAVRHRIAARRLSHRGGQVGVTDDPVGHLVPLGVRVLARIQVQPDQCGHLMPNAADRMRAAVDHVLATGGADGPATAQGGTL